MYSTACSSKDWYNLHRMLAAAACVALLAGCATEPAAVEDRSIDNAPRYAPPQSGHMREATTGATYHVVRGDTLYSIAFKRGLDFRDIARWNGIAAPFKIYADQNLRLSPPEQKTPLPTTSVASTSSVNRNAHPATEVRSSAAPVDAAARVPAPNHASAGSGVFEDVGAEVSAAPAVEPTPISAPAQASATPASNRDMQITGPAVTSAQVGAVPASSNPTVAVQTPPYVAPQTSASAPQESAPSGNKPASEASVANVGGVTWRWPSSGKVLATFVGGDQTRQGIDIGGNAGDPVQAAADGEVVYSGNGLLGYGELIIVKHSATFLSAYGHNRKRLVAEGAKVRSGQQIAEMGSSASARDELHFEIRKNGKPVNPLDFLPAR